VSLMSQALDISLQAHAGCGATTFIETDTRTTPQDQPHHLTMANPVLKASESTTCNPIGLFSLPREVRDIIWEDVVTDDWTPRIILQRYDHCRDEYRPHQPAMCRVSRQIRSETLPLFYSRTLFRVHFSTIGIAQRFLNIKQFHATKNWLEAIGERNLQSLQILEFHITFQTQNRWRFVPHFDRWQNVRLHVDIRSGQITIQSRPLPLRQAYHDLYDRLGVIAKIWSIVKQSKDDRLTTSELVRFIRCMYLLECCDESGDDLGPPDDMNVHLE
jgi:hypothetical protein